MYAVVACGGKQYKVAVGEKVKLEKIEDAELGDKVVFEHVLLLADGKLVQVGTPNLAVAMVEGKVVENARHDKVDILKFKRRKHHMKRQGHRQEYTEVEITKIIY